MPRCQALLGYIPPFWLKRLTNDGAPSAATPGGMLLFACLFSLFVCLLEPMGHATGGCFFFVFAPTSFFFIASQTTKKKKKKNKKKQKKNSPSIWLRSPYRPVRVVLRSAPCILTRNSIFLRSMCSPHPMNRAPIEVYLFFRRKWLLKDGASLTN